MYLSAVSDDPSAGWAERRQTRERMGETVNALGYKADVPARAKESVNNKLQDARDRIYGVRDQVSGATPGTDDVKHVGRRTVGLAQENPLGLAIGAAAVGFVAGLLIPVTPAENARLGPISDQVRTQALETGHDVIEHGRQVAQDVAETASQKAQEAAADIGDSVQETALSAADTAKDAAAEVKETAQDPAERHADDLGSSAKDSAEAVQRSAAERTPGGGS